MAKRQSFADKASKKVHEKICPICQGVIKPVKLVRAVDSGKSYKYKTVNIQVCKCNHSMVYGE
jgi:hypothetical protein